MYINQSIPLTHLQAISSTTTETDEDGDRRRRSQTKTETDEDGARRRRSQTKTETDEDGDRRRRRQTKTETDEDGARRRRRQTKTETLWGRAKRQLPNSWRPRMAQSDEDGTWYFSSHIALNLLSGKRMVVPAGLTEDYTTFGTTAWIARRLVLTLM